MPVPQYTDYISQITLPSGTTYHIKDSEARQWINEIVSGGLTFVVAWDGSSTPDVTKIPAGATVTYSGQTYTGTMAASLTTKPNIYLVHSDTTATGRDIYEEYVTVNFGTTETPSWGWEVLGNTDISLDVLGALAWKDNVTLNKTSDSVLGTSTTFTNAASAVTFTGGTNDTFVKSYPGATSNLETTSITGVGGEVTFDAVGSANDVTTTYVAFGTDTTASKVTLGTAKVANKTTLGTATTASKATAGTAVSVAKVASAATNISYIGTSSTSSILETATVPEGTETLVIGNVSVSQGTVTGTNGTQSITPYTFTDVSVPVVSVSADVSVPVISASDVTVPVISSSENRTASKVTTSSKTAATKSSSATTVATGTLAANGTGDAVMTGLGTATTGSAVTGIGTGTAAAQTITVGTNDNVDVATYNSLSLTIS